MALKQELQLLVFLFSNLWVTWQICCCLKHFKPRGAKGICTKVLQTESCQTAWPPSAVGNPGNVCTSTKYSEIGLKWLVPFLSSVLCSLQGFQGFGFGDGGFQMSFGIGAFPFGIFATAFNINDGRPPPGTMEPSPVLSQTEILQTLK